MDTSRTVGAIVVAVVLIVGVAIGFLHRRRDGVLAVVSQALPSERDLLPTAESRPDAARAGRAELLATLGVDGRTPVTLLQFSTGICAPCRAMRALCMAIESDISGVRHVDVDAESHLDAVRALRITRTPTLLVVDGAGVVVRRCVGLPTRDDLLAAISQTLEQQ